MDFSGLNSEQLRAVKQIDGPVLILAGAGSGKTTTMTHRIAYMIEQGISPYNILAVTFTNKAAQEMRERIGRITPDTRGMWMMTFHAMCLRILRYQSEILGYHNGFTVYDESDSKALIKRIMKEQGVDEKVHAPSFIQSQISKAKESAVLPDGYLEYAGENEKARLVQPIYAAYQQTLLKNNSMDFDDLLLNAVRLLELAPDVLDHYRERFHYIMVDEYQDTNYLQYRLISMLAKTNRNLCVVGDDDQCIYEWRGANIQNILDFEKEFPETKVIKLEQNYRSDANILNLANSVIKNNHQRKQKQLWTDREGGEKITYRRLPDDRAEASFVAGEIARLVQDEGYQYKDIAILYRKNTQSRAFEEKLRFYRIPARVLSGAGFYERKEIKDMLAYLRLIENPDDDAAMLRVINEPRRGIGAKTMSSLEAYGKAADVSLYGALSDSEVFASLSSRAQTPIKDFLGMIDECREELGNLRLEDVYDNVLRRSGYLTMLEAQNTPEADARIENIMELKTDLLQFEEAAERNDDDLEAELREERERLREAGFEIDEPSMLSRYLERAALVSQADRLDEEEDYVALMTLHGAKGLEFPVVFIPGMENGLFPGRTAFDQTKTMEEERRLCYVGITRAKKKLYLTSAQQRMLYGKIDYSTESLFLREMDESLLEGDPTDKQREDQGGGFCGDGGIFGAHRTPGGFEGTRDGYASRTAVKPFDPLRYEVRKTKQKISNEGFAVGDRIRHPKFGEGLLIEQDDRTMTVIFDTAGRKKLGKGFVELEKVEESHA